MQPGQLVICVGGDLGYALFALSERDLCPKQGSIYTVASLSEPSPCCGKPHVFIEEITLPSNSGGYPPTWFKPCARPGDFDKFMEQVLPPPAEARFEG